MREHMSPVPPHEADGGLRGYCVDPRLLPEPLSRRWRENARADEALASPFFDIAYVRAVADSRPGVRVAVIERDGEACGFFPFQYADPLHRLLTAGEPVGAHMTDSVGFIAPRDCQVSPRLLLRAAGLRHFQFTHLLDAQGRFGLRGERQEIGLAIDLRQGSERYWSILRTANGAFLADSERRRRRLREAHGELSFSFSSENAGYELNRLIEAKRDQYRRTGAADVLKSGWTRRLLWQLAHLAVAECQGVLSTLYAGDTWVASHFGLRSGELLHYWFPVHNPALGAFAPGRLLLMAIIDECAVQRVNVIERGVGTQRHKRDFANLTRTYYRGAWHLPGPRALMAQGAASLGWRIGAWQRSRQGSVKR